MNVDTAFRSIYGRDPNPEETNRFNRVGKELDIRDNDAIWAITFLLGHHLDLAKLMKRPYLINTLGAQKLYNNLGVALADECQSLSKHKILIAEESISPNYEDHITQPQKYDTLVY